MLHAFPDKSFTLVIKSNDRTEADRLVAYLRRNHADWRKISVFGGERPIARLRELAPDLRSSSEKSARACLTRYLEIGWTGMSPAACRNAIVPVPFNYRGLLWGWPNLFVKRMARVNSAVLLVGPYEHHSEKPGMNFVDTPEQLAALPDDYAGEVFTGQIDVIGPAARSRGRVR